MSIVDELRAAHTEYLQDDWDKCLITAWRTTNPVVRCLVSSFVEKHNMSHEDFYNLRRVPLHGDQQKVRVPRYVAAYIPRLNTLLWSDTLTDEQILRAMKNFDTQAVPADERKVKKEWHERNRAIKAAYAEKATYGLVKDQHAYTAKSNWKVCK